MKKQMRNSGFSLLEVIIYLTIVGIIFTMLISYAINIMEIGTKNNTVQETSANARYASERIKFLIRNADNIEFGLSDFDLNLADHPGSKITLLSPYPDGKTTIEVIDGILTIKQLSSDFNPMALNSHLTKITGLTFTNYSDNDSKTKYLGFVLTLVTNYGSNRQEYQQSVSLRSGSELRSN